MQEEEKRYDGEGCKVTARECSYSCTPVKAVWAPFKLCHSESEDTCIWGSEFFFAVSEEREWEIWL